MIWESGVTYITGCHTPDLEALGQQGVWDLSLWVRQTWEVLICAILKTGLQVGYGQVRIW